MSALGVIELANSDDLLDRHGPESYDLVREEFTTRLKNWLRQQDQWRLLDGDRFCLLLRGVASPAQLTLAMTKLERAFESDLDLFGHSVVLRIRAGFVWLKRGQQNQQELIRKASMALGQARSTESLYKVYDPTDVDRQIDENQLKEDLKIALDRGDFSLFYQPKVHASYLNLTGAEALLRWYRNGKSDQIVTPNHFVGVAESLPLIRPLTWWIIKSAVARANRWKSGIGVSVNIPPSLLVDDEIVAVTTDALDLHGLDPSRLTFEVTENAMVLDPEIAFQQLSRLRQSGVRVAIDDFGTGYSSLAYFRDLPADELKIDRSFVMAMHTSEADRAIIKAVIELSHNLEMKVVAEGVEDEKTAVSLRDAGCDELQGYYFDAPLPLPDFEKRHKP